MYSTVFSLSLLPSLFASVLLATAKPFKLSLLALTPSKASLDGRSCTGAMQIAVDSVNSRSDILADYEISVTFKEEGIAADLVPTSFLKFITSADGDDNKDGNSFNVAPILVGPFTFCQKVSHLASHFKMVQLSYGCTAATFTANRHEFPNLYRSTIPAEDSGVTGTYFTKFIGQWKEIAMLTYAGNSNEFPSNKKVYIQTVEESIKFLLFTSELDVDASVIKAFKESGARVIVIATSYFPMVAKFLCMAFDNGITAPRYAFLVPSYAFFSLDAVKFLGIPGCTREKMAEQFKQTFWTGIFFSAVEYTGNSSLGYDAPAFDKKLDAMLNYTKPIDYSLRHVCNDVMSQALLVLNRADGLLKAKYNKTLLSFREEPNLVMKVVNYSVATTSFNSLRAGRLFYSKRLEMDSEPTWTAQAVNGIPKMIYKLGLNNNISGMLYETSGRAPGLAEYNVSEVSQPIWFTENGRPPKDLSTIVHLFYNYLDNSVYCAVSLSVVLAVVQLTFILICLNEPIAQKRVKNKASNVLVLVSTILIDCCAVVTSVLYETNDSQFMSLLCYVRIFLATIAVPIILNSLLLRVLLMEISVEVTRSVPAPSIRPSAAISGNAVAASQAIPIPQTPSPWMNSHKNGVFLLKWRHDYFVLLGTTLLTVAEVLVPIISFSGIDGIHIGFETTPFNYNTDIDSYFDFTTKYCYSENDSTWMVALAAYHAFVMMAACCISYRLRSGCPSRRMRTEFRTVCIAVLNATAIFVCTTASLLIASHTTLRMDIFIYGLLIFSGSTSCIISYHFVFSFIKQKVRAFSG